MSEEESTIPAEWYAIAERDLGACQALLGDKDVFLPVAASLLQQAVEKYLKGYLISKGWPLRRIHQLDRLVADLTKFEPDFAEFMPACVKISAYYTEHRYTLHPASELTRSEVEESWKAASSLIVRIQSRTGTPPASSPPS